MFNTFIWKTLPLIVLCWLYSPDGHAQKGEVKFSSLTTKDGLSSNTVYSIIKDRYGFLWIATEDGLDRFDGTNFTVYKHDPENPNSIGANHIKTLYEDPSGALWVGTNGGSLSLYDRAKDSFVNFKDKGVASAITSITSDVEGKIWASSYDGLFILNPKNQHVKYIGKNTKTSEKLHTDVLICVFKDSKQNMWVGSEDGLYLYQKKTDSFKRFVHVSTDATSLPNSYIMTIAEDKAGHLWVGTEGGLSMLMPDGTTFKNYQHHTNDSKSISSDIIYAIAAESKNQLWIATEEGLDLLNISKGTVQRFRPDKRDESSLTKKSTRGILVDKQGICWVGTFQGGINKYDKNFTSFNLKESMPFDARGLSSPVVTSFAELKGKGVFIGTDGGGLNFFNPTSGLFDHFTLTSKRSGATSGLAILGLELAKNNQLWIATYLDGVFKLNPSTGNYQQFLKGNGAKNLSFNDVFCIKEDHEGNIWIGTNGGGINIYDPKRNVINTYSNNSANPQDPNLPSNNVIRAFEEDRKGNMWIGTFGSGISVWNPTTHKFKFINKINSGLAGNYILSILEDKTGDIWIGTSGDGLNFLNTKTGKFKTYTEKDGLPGSLIHKVIEDKQGNIWVSTNNGVSRFDKHTQTFTNFTHHNGLQNSPFILGSGICLSNGQIYFGGQEGFNYLDPSVLKPNKNIPPVVLTELNVDNKPILPRYDGPLTKPLLLADEINLDYKQNFSIGFVALNYTNSQQNQYEYKLHGFNKDWIKSGKEHVASYTNLDPGTYEFQVRASNNDGVWNYAGRKIKVVVNPPFYRTVFAYTFYVLLAAGILLYARFLGIRKLKRKFALEQERLQVKQLLEQERRQTEHLRELDSMKIKFLTNLSHEFRTPISLIVGPVDNLLDRIKEPEATSQLTLIKRNGRRLLNLVNQLLDFRKMEEQELKLHPTDGEIVGFIKEIASSFSDLAERKKIKYSFTTEADAIYCSFDYDKIERILFNLISNALKFTSEDGKIDVNLLTSEDLSTEEKVWITLHVTDTGIGIPDDTKEQIFENFYQNEVGPKVLNQGTGIGLSIAKEFVRMHGGTITVESEVGKGSCFTVTLPLVRTVQLQLNPAGKTDITPETLDVPIKSTTVAKMIGDLPLLLIVEDDEDFRFYLKDNLKNSYRIQEASNGKEGWQKALSGHPDIIVCDVNMPVMDGIELGKKIRSDKRTTHLPLILLTASTQEDEQIRGLESGASDYMTKPFNFAVLNAKIRNLLTLNKTFRDTYTRQIKMIPSTVEIESEHEKFMNKVLLYIEKNLNDSQLSVEALSKELTMSRGSLYKKILELTGLTPVEFIRSVRLEKAAVLLERSDLNIAQIAYQVGFSTPNYFTKAFKDKYEVTPSDYINLKKNQQPTTV